MTGNIRISSHLRKKQGYMSIVKQTEWLINTNRYFAQQCLQQEGTNYRRIKWSKKSASKNSLIGLHFKQRKPSKIFLFFTEDILFLATESLIHFVESTAEQNHTLIVALPTGGKFEFLLLKCVWLIEVFG